MGWNSLIFESYDTIKFANAFVEEEYRGKGIYKMFGMLDGSIVKKTSKDGKLSHTVYQLPYNSTKIKDLLKCTHLH